MKPLIIAITGPSDIGKGVILDRLLEIDPTYQRVTSHTDRPKRKGEKDGDEYYFVTDEEFTKMVDDEEFVEWQVVPSNGFRYGKTKGEMERMMEIHSDKVLFTRVNVINLPVFKRHFPQAKSLFIDMETNALIEYLRTMALIDSEEEFERRYKFATEERRRRHLADRTITRKDSDEEIVAEILEFIKRHGH
jgi:guanylate kinase